jgi:hypothetical protein
MKKKIFPTLGFAAAFAFALSAGFLFMQNTAAAEHDHDHAAHSHAAPASKKPAGKTQLTYTCTPSEFTLTQDGDTYTLAATIDTPTPGFSYEIYDVQERRGIIHAKLKLSGPEGMALQVLDTLQINHAFTQEGTLHALQISLNKGFNWGPSMVDCTH